jgi:hypothetical protein
MHSVADLESSQPAETVHKNVEVGRPLSLRCSVPVDSFPRPNIVWGVTSESGETKALELDDRVTMDFEGNLDFAYILPSDAKEGGGYACHMQNPETWQRRVGQMTILHPIGGQSMIMRPNTL